MSNRIQWDSRDAEKAAGYRRKGYTFGKIADLMHFSIDQARRMVEFVDPELVGRVPQEAQAQFGGYGDLWDDPSDYLRLLSPEAREGLAQRKVSKCGGEW